MTDELGTQKILGALEAHADFMRAQNKEIFNKLEVQGKALVRLDEGHKNLNEKVDVIADVNAKQEKRLNEIDVSKGKLLGWASGAGLTGGGMIAGLLEIFKGGGS